MKVKFLSTIIGLWLLFELFMMVPTPYIAWATFGEDQEKPRPEFTREGDIITAKLLPRAKSTSVFINFKVAGAELINVQGMDFEKADRPEVDLKDFKSALFVIEIGALSPGGEAMVSLTSDFFNRSTRFWIFNDKLETPWMDSIAQNLDRPDRVQELVIKVKDGGSFDSDMNENGRMIIIGGPKDSFWGYALGTLFIRYFGIFIVLSILMLGMIFSGKIFQHLEHKKAKSASKPESQTVQAGKAETPNIADNGINPEMATAVAVALHLHFSGSRASDPMHLSSLRSTAWSQQGRAQIMGERSLMYNRHKR